MSHCLVTGGAGFIGCNLVRKLLELGNEVTVLDNLSTGFEKNLEEIKSDIRFIKGDVRDRDQVVASMKGVEVVFHEAALASVARSIDDPWASNENNVTGILNMLLAARDAGVGRFVFAASSSAYGDTEVLPKVETMKPTPLSPYAITKLAGELYCSMMYSIYGLETVALRYFNVFGPRQDPKSDYSAVIPLFTTAVLNNKRPTIFGDGGQTRDFTFIDNVVSANLLASTAPAEKAAGKVFNIGNGAQTSLNTLLDEIKKVLHSDIEPIYAPVRTGDVRDSLADIEQARECLGYEPLVQLPEGLRQTIEWYSESLKA